ncbi:MAG TPA: DUF4190 domain-containing protein [Pirellulales bacterium]|nr:DUF4190 domain-containing protein [Pirellulales bacterium]
MTPATMSETTIRCPHCGASLTTAGLSDSTVLLCARCGSPMVLRTRRDVRRLSRRAVASLVLGVCTILFWCLAGIPAIVFGVLALRDIHRDEERLKGKELAFAGILSGALLGLFCTPFVVLVATGIRSSGFQNVTTDPIHSEAVAQKLRPLGLHLAQEGTRGAGAERSAWFVDREEISGVIVNVQESALKPESSKLEADLLAFAAARRLYIGFEGEAANAFSIADGKAQINVRTGKETESQRPFRLYTGAVPRGRKHVAMIVWTCDPAPEGAADDGRKSLTDAEVRELFEWFAAKFGE